MNQTTFSRRIRQMDPHVDDAFLAFTGLSIDALQQIREAMQASGQNFAETALQLGLMTRGEIERAMEQAYDSSTAEQPTIIESSLRRVASDRQVVLRQGTEVELGEQLAPILEAGNHRGEQMRALRTQLLLLSETSRAATMLAIVSPCAGEGRSQLAADLALSFAQLGKRTLLVDADLRRPQLHTLFGCDGELGLSDAIALVSTPYVHPVKELPQMSFLAAGKAIHTNPLELLSDDRFARIVDNWRENYAYVLIDTPPISEYADALAVATLARRVLVVSRAKHTSYKHLREMMRRLAITQSHLLGAVVNHF